MLLFKFKTCFQQSIVAGYIVFSTNEIFENERNFRGKGYCSEKTNNGRMKWTFQTNEKWSFLTRTKNLNQRFKIFWTNLKKL